MEQITAACICDVGACKDGNKTNLLFAGQILPEKNGGLAGIPVVKTDSDSPFTAAVFDGSAGGRGGGKAAYIAARGFRDARSELDVGPALESLLRRIHGEIGRQAGSAGTAAAALCIRGDRLSLADLGGCRVYLLRDSVLYLLSRPDGSPSACLGLPPGEPPLHTAGGRLHAGDRLLLYTRELPPQLTEQALLALLCDAAAPSDALGRLAQQVRAGTSDTVITALALYFD